jgi:hypothetical protein
VIVDREPGQYLGHPTTVLLEDGKTIIAVYPKGHGRGAIQMNAVQSGPRLTSGHLVRRRRLHALFSGVQFVESHLAQVSWIFASPRG